MATKYPAGFDSSVDDMVHRTWGVVLSYARLYFLFEKALLNELPVTLTRTIIVAFPASFAATAVDFMN